MNPLCVKGDKLWGEVMHSMYDQCLICGDRSRLQAHHLITRSQKSKRHKIENGVLLCSDCHLHATYAPHQDAGVFLDMLEAHRPDQYEWYWNELWTLEKPNYEEAILKLKEIKKALSEGFKPVWKNGGLYLE